MSGEHPDSISRGSRSSKAGAALTGGQIVVEWMAASGIRSFFHVPGESFLPVLDALFDHSEIEVVTHRHESGAAFAAEAYGKVTGTPAVCMATRGPGASNLSIGVGTAYYDATPMIALVGLVPTGAQGSRAFQEFAPESLYGSIAKQVYRVGAIGALQSTLEQVYETAVSGRPGPVVVGLPTDILYASLMNGFQTRSVRRNSNFGRRAPGRASPGDLEQLSDLFLKASRPALLFSTEANRASQASRLADLAADNGVPVFCGWRRFSAFDNSHPNFIGSLGLGMAPVTGKQLAEADLVLSAGFALEQITCESGGLNRPNVTIVQIAAGPDPTIYRHAPLAHVIEVVAEPWDTLTELLSSTHRSARVWWDKPERARPEPKMPTSPKDAVHSDVFFEALDAVLPTDAVISSDAGNFGQWVLRFLSFGGRRSFIAPLNGAMGYGLPGAIGAAISDRRRPCWSVSGDGGFMMTMSEMDTAVRSGLEVVSVVVDNSTYGTIRAKQESEFPGRPVGTSLAEVDFAGVARSLGWSAWTLRSDADIEMALKEVVDANGCRLIHVIVQRNPLALA